MKKYLAVILILVLYAGSLFAQKAVTLNVTNPKGKSLGPKSFVFLASNAAGQPLDRKVPITLHPAQNDTIFILFGNYLGKIPVDSTLTATELNVTFNKGVLSDAASGEKYPVEKLPPFDPNNIAGSRDISIYNDLENLIRGKFPNLLVRVNNRDNTKYLVLTSDQTTPMLIMVDGISMESFSHANDIIDVKQVKSIKVKRADPLYGFRGTGGVVEITLVKGGDI